jgi:hypothetical protein
MHSHWPKGHPIYPQVWSDEYRENPNNVNFTSKTKGQYLLDENFEISTDANYIDNYFIVQFQNIEKNRFCGKCLKCQHNYHDECSRYPNEARREYTFCSHFLEFAIKFANRPDPSCTYSEFIRGWLPQKFRLDIDIHNQPLEYCEKLKDILISIMIEILKPEFEINLSRDIIITDSSGETSKGYKYSKHIILDNYYCLNGDHTKAVFEEIYKRLPDEYKMINKFTVLVLEHLL